MSKYWLSFICSCNSKETGSLPLSRPASLPPRDCHVSVMKMALKVPGWSRLCLLLDLLTMVMLGQNWITGHSRRESWGIVLKSFPHASEVLVILPSESLCPWAWMEPHLFRHEIIPCHLTQEAGGFGVSGPCFGDWLPQSSWQILSCSLVPLEPSEKNRGLSKGLCMLYLVC